MTPARPYPNPSSDDRPSSPSASPAASTSDNFRYHFDGGDGGILRGRVESVERVRAGLEGLVEDRERLRDEVLAAIDRDESILADLLLAMYRPGVSGTDNPAYVKLRVEQLRLEREKRQAAVDCWRDTALIARDLVDQAERANEAARIEELLGVQRP